MSSFKPHHQATVPTRRHRRSPRRVGAILAAGSLIAVAVGVFVGLALTADGGGRGLVTSSSERGHDSALPPGYALTGQISPMGGQIIETPGSRSGTASAGGVTVTDGAHIAMGRIPLAYAVNPTWHLRNTTDQPVALGQPKVTVVEGCCPAEPMLGARMLAPGAETTLQFPTQMHPGMDGAHLFRLMVPVGASGDPLVVSVSGDFS
jgi:hypothetical protein